MQMHMVNVKDVEAKVLQEYVRDVDRLLSVSERGADGGPSKQESRLLHIR